MGFSREEYWSGLPCSPPGDLPGPGIKPSFLMSLALAGVFSFFFFFFLPLVPTGKPKHLQDLHQVTHLLGDTGNDNNSIKAPRPPHRAWFWGGGCCRETRAPATGLITEEGCRVSTSQTGCPVPSVPHRLCLRPSLDLSFFSNHLL